MRIWRAGHRYLIECDKCGCKGHAQVSTTLRRRPDLEAARAAWLKEVTDRRNLLHGELQAVVRQVRGGSLEPKAGDEQIQQISQAWTADLAEFHKREPADEVTEIAAACPWCGKGAEVVVEVLPEGVSEPAEWLPEEARAT